jgi:hypothetical protein
MISVFVVFLSHLYALHVHVCMSDTDVIRLSGDARYDSPGHCARMCSYTFMDSVSTYISLRIVILYSCP